MEYTKELSDKLKNAKSKEEVLGILGRSDFSKLSMDELENVSGGTYKVPKTHEEIDALWDLITEIYKKFGRDAACVTAQSMNAYSRQSCEFATKDVRELDSLRGFMHRALDGNLSDLDHHSIH